MTRVTLSEMLSFKVKIKSSLWLLFIYLLVTDCLSVTIKQSQALILNESSVLHRRTLISRAHSSQFMKYDYLGSTILTHVNCSPNVF